MFMVTLGGDFPLDDVEAIGARLAASGALVPGYEPPAAGLLHLGGLFYARDVDGMGLMLLPDRNLVSRMARIAKDGARRPGAPPDVLAADLMAFAQAMNIDIEPAIAFHELAHRDGNAVALEELVGSTGCPSSSRASAPTSTSRDRWTGGRATTSWR